MGMDVYGKNPIGKTGEYFRNSIWWWHPLAEYCQIAAPETALKCSAWHSNDGAGLNADDANALAAGLEEEIKTGRCAKYMETRRNYLAKLPETKCFLCEGRKINSKGEECSWCKGVGKQKDFQTFYRFSVENVQEFMDFLKNCGGFEIH